METWGLWRRILIGSMKTWRSLTEIFVGALPHYLPKRNRHVKRGIGIFEKVCWLGQCKHGNLERAIDWVNENMEKLDRTVCWSLPHYLPKRNRHVILSLNLWLLGTSPLLKGDIGILWSLGTFGEIRPMELSSYKWRNRNWRRTIACGGFWCDSHNMNNKDLGALGWFPQCD